MVEALKLENISIVLHRPKFPENIGSSARAMKNMGIKELLVVDPDDFDLTKIGKMATHASMDIVDNIKRFDTLNEALADFSYVVGTTARIGRNRQVIHDPADLAQSLIPVSVNNRIAIVFGREDRGLESGEVQLCHSLLNIPTDGFSSLNLSQAVMVVCYELFKAKGYIGKDFLPTLATRFELEQMYFHLKDILLKIDFIQKDNPDYWLNNLRNFFSRLPLRAKEVRIIRGICRQIEWYGNRDKE